MNCDLCGIERDLEHVCVDALKAENAKLHARIEWLEKTNFIRLRADLQEKELQVRELKKVVDGCKDTFVQFCGSGGAVIAHPPKCRFYNQGRQQDCTCNAKNTANDVMLSLRACRQVLDKLEKPVESEPTCSCGKDNDPTGMLPRRDIVCPKHDRR